MPCGSCGPSGNEIIEVKKRLGILPKQTAAEQTVATAVDRGVKMIKLEYTGVGSGSRTFMVGGVPYRAGNNVTNRIIMVKPEHVDKLLASGLFQVVQQPVAPEPVEAPKVKVEIIRKAEPQAAQPARAETTWTKSETAFERDIQAARGVAPTPVPVAPKTVEQSAPKTVETAKEVVKSVEPDFKADIEAAKAKKDKLAEAAKEMVSEYNKPVEAREMPSTLKEIKAAIPGATLDELMEWHTTEKRAAKPRKTIIAALEEEFLKR